MENNLKSSGPVSYGRGKWPTHEEIEAKLKRLSKNNPSIFKLTSIGQSIEGRELWVMKVSDNVEVDEKEPEFKYVANMHGDEIVGRDLMVMFLEDIAKRYGKDPVLTKLIDNTEIYIMPTLNPDGSMAHRRANAKWVDINRDFPDFSTSDNTNTPKRRTVETKAMMKFQAERHFAFSANFHGGDVVVNYPWDTTRKKHPLQELVKEFSLTYSRENRPMYTSSSFDQGVVRGFEWYEVNGGMQDWSFYYHDDLQVTVELSHKKWPKYSTMPAYYKDNKESLVEYLKNVHQGLGFYFPKAQSGNVKIQNVNGRNMGEFYFSGGEFYKVLPEGEYSLEITRDDGSEVRHMTALVSKNTLENSMQEL